MVPFYFHLNSPSLRTGTVLSPDLCTIPTFLAQFRTLSWVLGVLPGSGERDWEEGEDGSVPRASPAKCSRKRSSEEAKSYRADSPAAHPRPRKANTGSGMQLKEKNFSK